MAETIHIDGAAKSGSGTIVRHAMALCSLLGRTLHMTNIRARRGNPGLRPQHLSSVQACAQMCRGRLEGAAVGSREITYQPGAKIAGGYYEWDIGTAGSTTMLAMTVLPLACFADRTATFRISGGLFQDFAPSAYHMQQVLLPTLQRMGIDARLSIIRPGYVPRGGGIIEVEVEPVADGIRPLRLLEQGEVKRMRGIALSSRLRERNVSDRMARACQQALGDRGLTAQIETAYDETSLQEGAALAVWAETDTGCLLGADMAGQRGRSSERIGRRVAQSLLEDLAAGATVDRFLADQLIIYAALADGISEYVIPRPTEHVETNLWLAETFGARAELEGHRIRVEGIGHRMPR